MRYNCQENKRRDSKRKQKGMVQNKYIKFENRFVNCPPKNHQKLKTC